MITEVGTGIAVGYCVGFLEFVSRKRSSCTYVAIAAGPVISSGVKCPDFTGIDYKRVRIQLIPQVAYKPYLYDDNS